MHSRAFPAPMSFSLLLSAALLSGCGMGVTGGGGGGASTAAITGHVIGGNQPVVGSTIQLYAATGDTYGAQSDARIASSVLTTDGGEFTITGTYTCPSSSAQMYLVASGGNPGLPGDDVDNTALKLMAALGSCVNLTSSTNIVVNELTTVAAVSALAPFMTAYDHVGATTTNAVGLSNAFAMAQILAGSGSGQTPGDAPAGSTIPSAELDTLANVLASCVNTTGGTANDGSACGKLFALATPPSGVVATSRAPHASPSSGTPPSNTIDAALDIALNPGNNVAAIDALADPGGPFQPTLGGPPNDWTVAVNFAVGSRSSSNIAFDAIGNLWAVAPDALYELSPQGANLGSFPAMAGNGVAIDATGNIWVTTASNSLVEMPPTLGAPTVFTATATTGTVINGLAIDGFGNPWFTCNTCTSIYKLNPSTSSVGIFAVQDNGNQTNISIDTSEQTWLGNFNQAPINVFANSGAPLPSSPFGCGTCGTPAFVANDHAGNAWIVGNNLTRLTPGVGFTNYSFGGGLDNPAAVAIDGNGNAWVANTTLGGATSGSLTEFTNAGMPVSPDSGYDSDLLNTPQGVAVDGSGNVWMRNSSTATVTVFVGVGVPVVTPLALGVKNGTLGSTP
jgi:streptogramin lyase